MTAPPTGQSAARAKKPRRLSRLQLRNRVEIQPNTPLGDISALVWFVRLMSYGFMVIGIGGSLVTWTFDPAFLLSVLILPLSLQAILLVFEGEHRRTWTEEARRSGLSRDEAREIWRLGKAIEKANSHGLPSPLPEGTMTLYLAVDAGDLALIRKSQWQGLPDKPFLLRFTTSYNHARNMARDWYAARQGIGFVVKAKARNAMVQTMPRRVLGAREREEFWLAPGGIEAFNAALTGPMKQSAAVRGEKAGSTRNHPQDASA